MKTEFGGEKERKSNVIRFFFVNCQPKIIVRMIYLNKAIKRNFKNQMSLMLGHTIITTQAAGELDVIKQVRFLYIYRALDNQI